jgi:hypothetical protein
LIYLFLNPIFLFIDVVEALGMTAVQLELDFRSAIALALAEPEAADLQQLWRSLEPELVGLTQKEQLQVAGQALCDLAEVCQRRAELMWVEWQDSHNTEGPIPDQDFLAGLVQKTMFLDISELVRQPKSRRAAGSVVDGGESVVEEVTKEVALLLAGTEEEGKEPLSVAVLEHDEDIAAWATAVRVWMRRQGLKSAAIAQLQQGTGLSVAMLWLAGLLGELTSGLELEQSGGFYDAAGVAIALR